MRSIFGIFISRLIEVVRVWVGRVVYIKKEDYKSTRRIEWSEKKRQAKRKREEVK